MQNASLAFRFLTRNSSLGELCILDIQKHWEIFFRGIVKKYTVDLMLLIKFKKIISVNYRGISFIYGIFTPNPREFWWFFCLKFHILQCFFK